MPANVLTQIRCDQTTCESTAAMNCEFDPSSSLLLSSFTPEELHILSQLTPSQQQRPVTSAPTQWAMPPTPGKRCVRGTGDEEAHTARTGNGNAASWRRTTREEKQKRRCVGPQKEVSPKMDLRQAPTSGSGPAQRIPDSHGGSTSPLRSSSWKKPVTKPMSRHATSAVLCTQHSLRRQDRHADTTVNEHS